MVFSIFLFMYLLISIILFNVIYSIFSYHLSHESFIAKKGVSTIPRMYLKTDKRSLKFWVRVIPRRPLYAGIYDK